LLVGFATAPCLAQDAPAAPAVSQSEPENLELAQEVIDLAFPPQGRHAMLSRAVDRLMEQMLSAERAIGRGTTDAGEEQILQHYLVRVRALSDQAITEGSPALFRSYARGYARMFTREELLQIRAFVTTTAGAKYLQRSPDLLSDPDVAQANTVYMSRVVGSLVPLEGELRRELTEYRAHHPR
jgi:hypothetical protein